MPCRSTSSARAGGIIAAVTAPAANPRPYGNTAVDRDTNRNAGTAASGWGTDETKLHHMHARMLAPWGRITALTASPSGMLCTATASVYNASDHENNVYVHSNQPDRTVTATASNGAAHSYRTDSSGYADVYLHAASGDTVKVTVGAASCSTPA